MRHLLLPTLLAAACTAEHDEPLMVSPDGSLEVVFAADSAWKGDRARAEMESALARFSDLDLVYAHNDPMARGAWDAARQAGREGIHFVGIDALPDEGRRYVREGILDATIEYPTGGAEAVDLTLLACEGVDLPRDIVLGTRVFRPGDPEGVPIPSPGDQVMAELRKEHAEVLTTEPMTDHVFMIGMAQCTTDEPWRVVMNRDITERAARYPQIDLRLQSADDDTEKQRTLIRQFVDMGCNAVLVSPKESLALVAACREATESGVHVIVLDRRLGSDDYTCFIGGDNLAIGRAAGAEVRRLLPDGGRIVELRGLMTSSPAQERHRGFVEALDLAEPR